MKYPKVRGSTSFKKLVLLLIIIIYTVTIIVVFQQPQNILAANQEIISSGKVADISFSGTTAINNINDKTYNIGAYGGSGTGTGVKTPYGAGIKFSGGQYQIPTADLGISDSNTTTVTVSFDMQWNNEDQVMPVGFTLYDNWIQGGYFGYNSGSGEIFGIDNPLSSSNYIHVTDVFNKGSYSANAIYINGVAQTLSQKTGSQNNSDLSTWGSYLCLSGWMGGSTFRLNGSTLTNIEIWNRGLTDSEASTVYAESLLKKAEISKTTSDISAAGTAIRALSGVDKTNLMTRLNTLIQPTLTSTLQTDHNHLSFNINDTSQNYTYKLYKRNVTAGESNFVGEGDFPYSGLVGNFNFDDGTAYNVINNKDYAVGAYGVTGGSATEVSTPYGAGLRFNGGQIQIPTSDLNISDTNTSSVTVSFDLDKIDSSVSQSNEAYMPIGFGQFDYAIYTDGTNRQGFNTGNGDIYGIDTPLSYNTYNHYTIEFTKGSTNTCTVYINGVKQYSYQVSSSQLTANAVFGSTLNISGWGRTDMPYRLDNGIITGLKVWNRALSSTEVENVYNYSNGLSTPSATLLSGTQTFDGTASDYINIGKLNMDFHDNYNIKFTSDLTAFKNGERIFDFGGNSYPSDNILANNDGTADMLFYNFIGTNTNNNILYSNAFNLNVSNNWILKSFNGNGYLYKDNLTPISNSLTAANNILRTNCYIGKSNCATDPMLSGTVSNFTINTYATSYDDYMIQDTSTPSTPTVSYTHAGHQSQFSFNSTDNVNTYQYYVVATGDDGSTFTSPTITTNGLTSNVSYKYTIDQAETGTVPSTSCSNNLDIIEPSGNYYIHVDSINANGFVSDTKDSYFEVYGNIIAPPQSQFTTTWMYPYTDTSWGVDSASQSVGTGGYNNQTYLKLTGSGIHETCVYYSNLWLKPNTTYELSAMYRLPNEGSTSSRIFGIVDNAGTADLYNITSSANYSNWEYIHYTFKTDSVPTDEVRIYLPAGITEVDVADFNITEEEPLPTITPSYDSSKNTTTLSLQPNDQSQSYSYKVNKAQQITNGLVGDFNVEQDGSLTNLINNKNYKITNTYDTGASGGGVISTPYGNGVQLTGGQINIPISDLNISNYSQIVTVSLDYKWSGLGAYGVGNSDNGELFGFGGLGRYDAWTYDGYLGFNTFSSDLYGISYNSTSWHHLVYEFYNGDYTKGAIYLNGVKQSLSQKLASQYIPNANFGTDLTIGGVIGDTQHIPNGSEYADIKVWNRGLSDQEAESISNSYSQVSSSNAVTNDTVADTAAPNPITSVSQTSSGTTTSNQDLNFSWIAPTDNGTTYDYYADVVGETDNYDYYSNKSQITCTSGIKEYWWSIDTNTTGTPTGSNKTSSTSISINPQSLGLNANTTYYLHIMAVDYAGNKSNVYNTQVSIPPIINETVNSNAFDLGHINPLTSSYEFDNAFTINTDSNSNYNIDVQATSKMLGIKYNIDPSHIKIRIHGTSTWYGLSNTGQVTLLNNQSSTPASAIQLDLQFATDWTSSPDSYSVQLNITSVQN